MNEAEGDKNSEKNTSDVVMNARCIQVIFRLVIQAALIILFSYS